MEEYVRNPAYFVAYLSITLEVFVSFGLKAAVELQPHRAYYTISMMGRPALNTSITEVRGTMMVEMNKVCGGWTVQQRSEIWQYLDDETVKHIRWSYVTYEADDGTLFKFNTFRKINDELVEDIRGQAKRNGNLVDVFYQKPKKVTLKLPEGTLFPTQHTIALLKTAEEGNHMFSQIVFDGSSTDGASQVNTFVGAKKVTAGNPANKSTQQFAAQPFWPVQIAVYEFGKTNYESDYVTTEDLLHTGIITQYVIDDGTIKIRGILDRIELLNKDGC